MWSSFWRNCCNKSVNKLPGFLKLRLLNRSVVACFAWKISRWPFQKSVAVALDKLQCNMTSRIIKCVRQQDETIDHYDRRRKREARNLCVEDGMWSQLWCRRVINWDRHIRRGSDYKHICLNLLVYRDSLWLQFQRSAFVAVESLSGSCNTLEAGRTGTRCNIGRPQIRWQDGVNLAERVADSRTFSHCSSNALTVETIINEYRSFDRTFIRRRAGA